VFEFTETILVKAAPSAVWEVMSDIEGWWPASNPDHESLERLDDRDIEVGAGIRIMEKIAGIRGETVGVITEVKPTSAVTWEAPKTRYRWHGIPVIIGEGVTWRIEPHDGGASGRVSAHVWAKFPSSVPGRILEWVFVNLLDGVEKDREHA
jgi:hypothetical protein